MHTSGYVRVRLTQLDPLLQFLPELLYRTVEINRGRLVGSLTEQQCRSIYRLITDGFTRLNVRRSPAW